MTKGTIEAVDESSILLDDGSRFPLQPGASRPKVHVEVLGQPLSRVDFDVCPICLCEDDLTDEHVPPASVGGRVLTRTCASCNNGFGTIEESLTLRRTGRMKSAAFSANGVLGKRKIREVRLVDTEDGKFVLYLLGPVISEVVEQILSSDEFTAVLVAADPAAFKIASLKQFYLAACINEREVLQSQWGLAARAELLAALASSNASHDLAPGPCAAALAINLGPGSIDRSRGVYSARRIQHDRGDAFGFAFGSFAFIGSERIKVRSPSASVD